MRPPRVSQAPSPQHTDLVALHPPGQSPQSQEPESLVRLLPLGCSHTRVLPGKLGTQDVWKPPPLSPEGTNRDPPGHSSSCCERSNLFLPTTEIPLQLHNPHHPA